MSTALTFSFTCSALRAPVMAVLRVHLHHKIVSTHNVIGIGVRKPFFFDGKPSIYFKEHHCHLVRENWGAEAYLPNAPQFSQLSPLPIHASGSYEYIGFMGRGFGGWVAAGDIPFGYPPMEHIGHLARENRRAEAYFAERSPVFATKPPSRTRKSGSYEFVGFTGKGFGGWVTGGNVPFGYPAFVCEQKHKKRVAIMEKSPLSIKNLQVCDYSFLSSPGPIPSGFHFDSSLSRCWIPCRS
jgi:hypothetical protein